MLVDFMIIGAQKCGTTSLAAQLAAHADICFCRIKEPGFFNQAEDWRAGLKSYHRLYSPTDGQICGEASTMYTFLPEWLGTHSRLFEYNPDLKLIYVMRHPVERVVSSYSHDLVRGWVKESVRSAILKNPAYINRTRYGVQIRPYIELFGRERIMLIVFEEYVAHQLETLAEVADFIGVPVGPLLDVGSAAKHKTVGEWYWKSSTLSDIVNSRFGKAVRGHLPEAVRKPVQRLLSNKLEEKPHLSPELRQTIWRLLEDDVRTVEELLGRTLDVWRTGDAE